jgi:cystathionine beta-synthase
VARPLGPEAVVVVVIPDSGRGYLSKLYNDGWMADFGFSRSGRQPVAEVLAHKGGDLPPLIHVHPEDSVRDVITILREFGVSQVPVLKVEPPVMAAEVLGSVHDRDLLQASFQDPGLLERPVGDVIGPPLPTIGVGEAVELAVTRMERAGAVLVFDAGHPVGILTRSDVLGALIGRSAT